MRKILILLLTLSAILTGCGNSKTVDYSVEVISLPEQKVGMADVILSDGFDKYKLNDIEYLDKFVEDVSNKMGIPKSKASGSIVIMDSNKDVVGTVGIKVDSKKDVKYNYITAK